jgi:hypothetical protein
MTLPIVDSRPHQSQSVPLLAIGRLLKTLADLETTVSEPGREG